MTIDSLGERALDYLPCRYGNSRLVFRGPLRNLMLPYIAFLGGTETYGKFVERPFVAELDMTLEPTCINFGCVNAGVDVFLRDPFLPGAAHKALLTVLQVPCAQNLSNRHYLVHPRRNDRFVSATDSLKRLYPDVDFAAFHFNKHLLSHLKSLCAERYHYVETELHTAWVARMQLLLGRIDGQVLLLWVSERAPEDTDHENLDPMHVNRQMLDEITPHVAEYVEVILSDQVNCAGVDGMVFNEMEAPAAQHVMGPLGHRQVAKALRPVLESII